MFLSIMVQLAGPLSNLLDQACLGIRKVHKCRNIISDINLDFKEKSLFQEGVISEMFQRLDKTFFQDPKELDDLINMGNLVKKILAKTGRYR